MKVTCHGPYSSATPALPLTFCLRSVFPTCLRESHKNRCSAEPTFIAASPFHEGGEVQISKETWFCGGLLMAHWFVDSLISNKRQPDIPAHWIIKWTQDQSIRSWSSFTVELTCLLVLTFFFFTRELHNKELCQLCFFWNIISKATNVICL